MKDADKDYYSLLSERKIELDYIIAEKDTMKAVPLAAELLEKASGVKQCKIFKPSDEDRKISWALTEYNYIVRFSADICRVNISEAEKLLHSQILEANRILEEYNAVLFSSAVYPVPCSDNFSANDSENKNVLPAEIDMNYHYMKFFLPFKNEDQFFRLHTAVRLILPILPALTSASPVIDSKGELILDSGLEILKHKLDRKEWACRSIIPEPLKNRKEYEGSVTECLKCCKDNKGNSRIDECRAVTANFDEGTLSVRIFDMQESPHVNFAVVRFVTYVLEMLVNSPNGAEKQASISNENLSEIFDSITMEGLKGIAYNGEYLRLLGIEGQEKMSAWGIWMLLAKQVKEFAGLKIPPVENILKTGSLSERITRISRNRSVRETCLELADCLEENIMMLV